MDSIAQQYMERLCAAVERLADGTEKLVEFAAVDINATIEQEVARRTENIEDNAIKKYAADMNKRTFIGKPT